MYRGYRVALGGYEVDDTHIVKGSYSAVDNGRIIDQWTDGNQTEHEIVSSYPKYTISFTLREHSAEEHELFTRYVRTRHNFEMTFYDDINDMYVYGKFKMNPVKWNHKNTHGRKINYGPTEITIIQY